MKDGKEEMKMRRLISFGTVMLSLLAILLVFYSVVLAQDVFEEEFPNSETVWEKAFQGKIRDFKVGERNITVLTDEEDLDVVSYLDDGGNELWRRSFKYGETERGYVKGIVRSVSMSRDGRAVLINFISPESPVGSMADVCDVNSYDENGNVKWKTVVSNPGLTLSPTGKYAISTQRSGEEMEGHLRVFDNTTGIELWDIPERIGVSWFAKYLTEEEIIYVETDLSAPNRIAHLKLLDVSTGNVKWERELRMNDGHLLWLNDAAPQPVVSDNGQMIAVIGHDAPFNGSITRRAIMVLDSQGKTLWENNTFVYINGLKFSQDNESLVLYDWDYHSQEHVFYVIESQTGAVVWKKALAKKSFPTIRIEDVGIDKNRAVVYAADPNDGEIVTIDLNSSAVSTHTKSVYFRDKTQGRIISLSDDRRQLKMISMKGGK